MPASTLGIIAGGGRLPLQLAEACQAMRRNYFIIALEEAADRAALQHLPHAVVRLGAAGAALAHLRHAGAQEVVLAGQLKRPSMASLRPDAEGAKLLKQIGAAFFGGDDAILRAVVKFFEQEGFTVVGAHEVLATLTVPAGVLGKYTPDARANADIACGFDAARAIGKKDAGQAAIVEGGEVLGVEDGEGTNALIARAAKKRRMEKSGVLVKAKKPGQESRVDLPAVGPETVESVHKAGFAGIAIEANMALVLDKEQTIARADALGIFIVAV